jgi:hypothetical protein
VVDARDARDARIRAHGATAWRPRHIEGDHAGFLARQIAQFFENLNYSMTVSNHDA